MYRNLNLEVLGISGRQSELIELTLTYGFKGLDLDIGAIVKRVRTKGLDTAQRFLASGLVWLGAFSWVLTLMALLAFARRWVGPRLFALVTAAGGCCMLYFGLRFIWRGVMGQ